MPISHELLPSGQSVASIVYVPASTCTTPVKSSHEPAPVVVEPLKRYVPGVGAVTVIPGLAPTVLGSPVTRGYRFANSYPPLRLVLSGRIHSCAVVPDSNWIRRSPSFAVGVASVEMTLRNRLTVPAGIAMTLLPKFIWSPSCCPLASRHLMLKLKPAILVPLSFTVPCTGHGNVHDRPRH